MTGNDAQAQFWNADPGRMWVRHQPGMDQLLAGVTGLILAEAAPADGDRVLDVGCGAGATTLALARAVAPRGRVLGVDVSAPLLDRARDRALAEGLDGAVFQMADAQDMALPPGGFDLVVSRFGVMFFADPVAAFANLGRALAPGGRMVLAAWAAAEVNPFFSVPARIAAERLGPPPPSDPLGPGPTAFRDRPRVEAILRAAGLGAVSSREVAVDLVHPGGVAPVLEILSGIGGLPGRLRETGGTAEDMAAILAEVGDAFAPMVVGGELRLPARVNLFLARAAG